MTTLRPSSAINARSTCAATLGERFWEADALDSLGDTHQAAGASDAAREAWQQALKILEQLDHHKAEQLRANLAT